MIKLADYTVSSPDDDLDDDFGAGLDPSQLRLWCWRAWPGFGSVGLGLPVGYFQPPWIGVNRYRHYHTRASRWSFGHFLASAQTADKIRNAAFGDNGTENNQITLQFTSPGLKAQEPLTANVYLMPPVPLFQFEAGTGPNGQNWNGLYLLTVVDLRYFWWEMGAPEFNISDTTTWQTLWKSIVTAVGSTIQLDQINAAYLNPSRALDLTYEYLPLIIDAACASIGHEFVVDYDGKTLSTQAFKTALDAMQQDDENNPNRRLLAGGDQFRDTL